MARTVNQSRNRKRPGPHAGWGLLWTGIDSFFDHRVQAILLTRKEYPGWPIRCWEAVEEVTHRRHPIVANFASWLNATMKISFKRKTKCSLNFTYEPFGILKKVWKVLKNWWGI